MVRKWSTGPISLSYTTPLSPGTLTDPAGVKNDEEIVRVFEVKHNDAAEPDPAEDFLALVLLCCVGGLLALVACTGAAWFCVRRRKLRRIQLEEEEAYADMAQRFVPQRPSTCCAFASNGLDARSLPGGLLRTPSRWWAHVRRAYRVNLPPSV